MGASRELVKLCSSCLVPSGAQRDLFQDSALAAAESAVKVALAEQRLDAAWEGLALARKVGASCAAADAYAVLIDAAERDHEAADARLSELEDSVTPLASKLLGSHAFAYLAARWRSLAKQLRGTAFSPSAPKLHASYANAMAAHWRGVIDDVESEARWQEHPVLVARLAEAYGRSSNRSAARRAWAMLCWAHPDAAGEALGGGCADPLLARRWREFCDSEPELPRKTFLRGC